MTRRVEPDQKASVIGYNVLSDTAASKQDDSEVMYNDLSAEFLKGRQAGSYGWLHSPSRLELFSLADQRLTRVSDERGKPVKQVDKVRAARTKNSKKIYLYPAEDGDTDAIQVKRYESGAFINLESLLGPARLTVRSGYRERYAIEFAGNDSPVGKALVIDLSKRLERREEPDSKRTGKTAIKSKQASEPSTTGAGTATTAPTPEPAKPAPTEN